MNMSFEERTAAIGALLRDEVLKRYNRPDYMSDDIARREIADMVSDLNHEWPVMSRERFTAVAADFHRHLRKVHGSRNWPTIAAMVKALREASKLPATTTSEDEPPHIYDMVADWWREKGGAFPSLAKRHHAARLVQAGLATWGELRRKGFPIPDERVEEAKAEPDPHHEAKLAEIAAVAERLRTSGWAGKVAAAPEKRGHWAKAALPNDPRWKALKEARERAGVVLP